MMPALIPLHVSLLEGFMIDEQEALARADQDIIAIPLPEGMDRVEELNYQENLRQLIAGKKFGELDYCGDERVSGEVQTEPVPSQQDEGEFFLLPLLKGVAAYL